MLSRRATWSVVVLAMLTMTVSYVDRQTLSVIAPEVTKALHITDTQYGWLGSAFSFAYLIATPLAGWWIDRRGARRGLVWSVLTWSLIAALHALVPNFAVLFGLRIALSLAEGPGFPGAAQTVQRMLPPESRSRGFGLLFTGSSIGAMIVPPLAARLAAAYGWRVTFLGTTLVAAAWIPLWIYMTSKREVRERLDLAPPPAAERPNLLDLLRAPVIQRGIILVIAVAPVLGMMQLWGAKYLVRAFRIDQKYVGDYLWLPPLCLDAGAILVGDLASRLRRYGNSSRWLLAVAMVMAATIGLLPYAATPWQAMAVMGVACAGGGAMYTLATSDMLSQVPASATSFAGGTIACGQSLAMVIANPLIGAAVDHSHNYDGVALALGCWVLPGALLWIVWRPRASERFGLQV